MRRFRAYFKVSDPNNVNNEMIQKQRSIWVDLINQAWLVSNHFKAQIGLSDNPPTGLSDEERKRIETAARKDFAELKLRMPTFSPDDDWFPLVVGNDEELETKIKRVKVLFEEFHRTDVDTGRLDRSEAS